LKQQLIDYNVQPFISNRNNQIQKVDHLIRHIKEVKQSKADSRETSPEPLSDQKDDRVLYYSKPTTSSLLKFRNKRLQNQLIYTDKPNETGFLRKQSRERLDRQNFAEIVRSANNPNLVSNKSQNNLNENIATTQFEADIQ
jgi:hypothetical protein